jgi:hypothetical protein
LALAAPADAVYVGGPIVTMDEKRPTAEVIHGQTLRQVEEDTKGYIVGDDSVQCIESPRCYQRFVAWRSHRPMTELFGVPYRH